MHGETGEKERGSKRESVTRLVFFPSANMDEESPATVEDLGLGWLCWNILPKWPWRNQLISTNTVYSNSVLAIDWDYVLNLVLSLREYKKERDVVLALTLLTVFTEGLFQRLLCQVHSKYWRIPRPSRCDSRHRALILWCIMKQANPYLWEGFQKLVQLCELGQVT